MVAPEATAGGDVHSVVIAGSGQAGYQTAAALRNNGFAGSVVLLGEEPGLPYQRPPLSKGYLSGAIGMDGVRLRDQSYFDESNMQLRTGQRIVDIDRQQRCVGLASGEKVAYDHLVLALGARNREITVAGAGLAGVVGLRSIDDADALRAALPRTRRAVVIGAGFIGMEFAVAARDAGVEVTVVEARSRLMPRVLSEPTAEFLTRWHNARGVRTIFETGVARVLGTDGMATGVETESGIQIEADLVVTGIGIRPNVELAEKAGLAVDNGIEVDELLRTEDDAISAIGDCACFPSKFSEHPVRLESVQNAVDQARCVADRLTGKPSSYTAVPWFWSDQGSLKLQIAGLTDGHDATVVRGDREQGAFTTFCFRESTLLGAESVSRAGEHLSVRRILAAGASLSPEQAADPNFDLRAYSKQPF